MGGLFPLSRLVTLSHFQSLSFLSVRISLDMALHPAHNYRLELPKLEGLRVQVALASHHQVDTPINIICRNLKLLDLRYRLELDLENPQEDSATWMEFDGVDALEELQVDLVIHVVTEVDSVEPLAAWLQKQQEKRGQHGQHGQHGLHGGLQEMDLHEQQERLQRQLEQQLGYHEWQHGRQRKRQDQRRWRQERYQQQDERRQRQQQHIQWLQEEEGQQQQQVQHLRFMISIYTRWQKWLNLPNSLTHVQQSSLKVTLFARMHQGASRVIKNMVEEILVWRLPQLTELTTSEVLRIFPKHLRKLRLHGFAMSDSLPSIALPSLVSLEIIADSPDHLLVMGHIHVPRLRVLRIQVEDGPGTLHKHDWGAITNSLLDHISLRIKVPRDKQGDHVLCFHLSLSIFFRPLAHCTYISPNQHHYSILSMPALGLCPAHHMARLDHYQQCGMRNW